VENILRGAPGLSLLEPPPDAAKREGEGAEAAPQREGQKEGGRMRRESGIKTLALDIPVRWDLGTKRIKTGEGWGVDSGLGTRERGEVSSSFGLGTRVASQRSWPWEYAPRKAVCLYAWQRLKLTASIGLVVASWGQQERVNDRPLIKRRTGTRLFLLKKMKSLFCT